MQAIRHLLLLLAGLVVLAFVADPVPALWAAVAVAAYTAVNRSSRLLGNTRHAVAMSAILTGLSLAVILIATVLLLVGYGWIPAAGLVVIWLIYLGAAENPHDRARRRALHLRNDLLKLVRERLTRSITDDQLTARASTLLGARLRGLDFTTDAARSTLTSADGLSPAEHRQLLQVLARHLGRAERAGMPSRLHETVREQLGSR
jgi:hypothetical protein